MTQIILNGIYLPQTSHDKYYCHEIMIGDTIQMISGRMVTEVRGLAWVAHYEYDGLPDSVWRTICPYLIGKTSISCSVLPDSADDLVTTKMLCTDMTYPTFAFAKNGKAVWHNIAFTMQEVKPHD